MVLFQQPFLMSWPSINRSVAEFDPTTVSGLELWVKADAGITKDGGDLVSNWADQSGNSNDLAQGTGSKQPLWVDAVHNSKPIIRFDGTDDRLFKSTFASGTLTQPNTIFIVAEFPAINDDFLYDSDDVNSRHAFFRTGGNYAYFAGNAPNFGASNSAFAQFTNLFKTGTNATLRRNGSDVGSAVDAGSDTFIGFSLGSTEADTQFAAVDVAEILIYDAEITGTDRTNIENYLIDRWGL